MRTLRIRTAFLAIGIVVALFSGREFVYGPLFAAPQNEKAPAPTGQDPVGAKQPDPSEEELKRLFEQERESKRSTRNKQEGPNGSSAGNDGNQPSYKLDIMAAADLLGRWDRETPHTTDNRFAARELEVGLSASVDHLGRGILSVASHDENGEQVAELHEAYLAMDNFLPRTSLRLGKMFFDVGRLNTIHRHDWSFSTAPIVHEALLGEEAASDTGAELRFLMPWPFWQELSVGVFNGRTFGHAHSEGDPKQNPLVTVHLKQFVELGTNWGTQFGFSYLRWHPTENPNRVTQQSGIDAILKWKKGKLASFQWLSEVWYRETRQKNERPFDTPGPPVETFVGGYTFIEYQFHENWFAGIRLDGLTEPNKRGQLGYTIPNGSVAESLIVTFKPSEFSYFRVTGERSTDIESGEKTYQASFQATFIVGAHPSHVY